MWCDYSSKSFLAKLNYHSSKMGVTNTIFSNVKLKNLILNLPDTVNTWRIFYSLTSHAQNRFKIILISFFFVVHLSFAFEPTFCVILICTLFIYFWFHRWEYSHNSLRLHEKTLNFYTHRWCFCVVFTFLQQYRSLIIHRHNCLYYTDHEY